MPTSESKWAKWGRRKKIRVNKKCLRCNELIHWRSTTGLCRKCAGIERRGEKNYQWTGRRHVSSNGYIYIYYPRPHHRVFYCKGTPYVFEHIIVWEESNKKLIPDGYTIHHLNGIRTDNRPENLIAIKRPDHKGWTYSKCLQERIRELEEIIMENKLIKES